MNRTVKTTITQHTGNKHRQWDNRLPEVAFSIDTAVSESTKFSPTEIIYSANPTYQNQFYHELERPPEARPRIMRGGPPRLNYISSVSRTAVLTTPSTNTVNQPTAPLPTTDCTTSTTELPPEIKRSSVTITPIHSNLIATAVGAKKKTTAPAPTAVATQTRSTAPASTSTPVSAETTSPNTERQKKNKALFDGITVYRPDAYIRHQQYTIHRPRLPPVKVTVLTRSLVRLRCKGCERIIKMTQQKNK